jgi:hypothetical protein
VSVVRYDFVRDGGQWKIDDICGDAKPPVDPEQLASSLKD